MKDPVFEIGDKVVVIRSLYPYFTEGEEFTVVQYTPAEIIYGYHWDASVQVVNSEGTQYGARASRFKKVEPK